MAARFGPGVEAHAQGLRFCEGERFRAGHTRDLRVLWALEEMQLPFEIVGLDHPANDLSTEAYRKLEPLRADSRHR